MKRIVAILFLVSCSREPPGDWVEVGNETYQDGLARRLDSASEKEAVGYDLDQNYLVYWGHSLIVVDLKRSRSLALEQDQNCGRATVENGVVYYSCWHKQQNRTWYPEAHTYHVQDGKRTRLVLPAISDLAEMEDARACGGAVYLRGRKRAEKGRRLFKLGFNPQSLESLSEAAPIGSLACSGNTLVFGRY